MKYSSGIRFLVFAVLLSSCGKQLSKAGFTRIARSSLEKTEGLKPGEVSGTAGLPRNDQKVKKNEQNAMIAKAEDEENSKQIDPEVINEGNADWVPTVCHLFACTILERYRICRKGSIPGHNAQFTYIPLRDFTQRVTVHGVEFRWPDLKQKLSLDSGVFFPMERKASKDTNHYYLNARRCAYGRRYMGSGPLFFAVNKNCTKVFYFQTAPYAGWHSYMSVEKYFKRQLKCSFSF